VRLRGREQLLVFDVPDFLVCPTGNVGHELAKTPMGIPPAQFPDRLQQRRTPFAVHGRCPFDARGMFTSDPGSNAA
jgi:hypothetical protein